MYGSVKSEKVLANVMLSITKLNEIKAKQTAYIIRIFKVLYLANKSFSTLTISDEVHTFFLNFTFLESVS